MLNYIVINHRWGEGDKMEQYFVYMHTNKLNNKKYIGITKQAKPEYRWGINGCNYKESPHFYSAIQKYGWDNFEHDVIAKNLSKQDACEMERELIAKYQTQNNQFGYNIFDGGTAPNLPQETREKIAKGLRGNKNGLGKPCSEEKKKKISEAQKGKTLTEEHKKKLSKPKSVTYPCSEEKRQHIINAKKDKKSIVCIETNVVYESIHECARIMQLEATAICTVLKGRHKSTGGYHFKYNDI